MRKTATLAAGLVALALLAGLAAPAEAQIMGLYYQEVEKDGRTYVFNTPEALKAFEASGEMGVSITLIGRGVDGKTVVAQNETAADLYFFRHNLPGYDRKTPAPPKLPFDISWKDGKTTIQTKSSQLVISNRVQLRFTQTDPEVGDSVGSFRVRRGKTKFDGWIYSKDLTYELQLNWPDTSNALEDANINYDFTKGKKTFMVKAGQFKVPFGRQELTSSGSQQFVDRSIVSNEFAKGRDLGLQLWGTPLGGKIDWRVGVFNGGGRNRTSNDNDAYQYNARLTWQPFGDVKYSETDFDSKETPLFAIAAQYESNDKFGTTTGVDTDREIVGADVVFKYKGIFAFAEYFDAAVDREVGASFDQEGLSAQVGYRFAKPFEVALRYAAWDPSKSVANNDRTETGIAFGYYFNKHNNKIQADFRQVEDDATGRTDKEFRLQYQFIF